MNSLHADLARAVVDTRRAEASQRRLATEAKRPRRRTSRAAATTTPWPQPIPITRHIQPRAPAVLEALLALVAERVAEHGTAAEARVLELVAAAVLRTNPGAAAALVDWNGAEIARLRAFGLVHGVVVADLSAGAQSALLDQILGTELSLAG